MNLFTKQKQTHRSRNGEQGIGNREGEVTWETGMDIQTLLCIKHNTDLLHSTGNFTQYPVMTYMEKESKKEWYMDS